MGVSVARIPPVVAEGVLGRLWGPALAEPLGRPVGVPGAGGGGSPAKGIMNMGNESNLRVPKSVVLDSAGGTKSYTPALKGFGILIEEVSCLSTLNTFRYLLTVYMSSLLGIYFSESREYPLSTVSLALSVVVIGFFASLLAYKHVPHFVF